MTVSAVVRRRVILASMFGILISIGVLLFADYKSRSYDRVRVEVLGGDSSIKILLDCEQVGEELHPDYGHDWEPSNVGWLHPGELVTIMARASAVGTSLGSGKRPIHGEYTVRAEVDGTLIPLLKAGKDTGDTHELKEVVTLIASGHVLKGVGRASQGCPKNAGRTSPRTNTLLSVGEAAEAYVLAFLEAFGLLFLFYRGWDDIKGNSLLWFACGSLGFAAGIAGTEVLLGRAWLELIGVFVGALALCYLLACLVLDEITEGVTTNATEENVDKTTANATRGDAPSPVLYRATPPLGEPLVSEKQDANPGERTPLSSKELHGGTKQATSHAGSKFG